jgi:excinuclease UvrABC nuclease subunit
MEIEWSNRYNHNEDDVQKYAPTSAGVYILLVKKKDSGKWRRYYVGQAKNLKQRLLDHLSDSEENECIKKKVTDKVVGFRTAIVSKQSDRDGIEKFLIDEIEPKCNDNDPGGQPIPVNLP